MKIRTLAAGALLGVLSLSTQARLVGLEDTGTNNASDIFLYDRQLGTTENVSAGLDGGPANGMSHLASISADGRFVAFLSEASNLVAGDDNNLRDVFLHDRLNGTTELVSKDNHETSPNSSSASIYELRAPALSADGRYVAFKSPIMNPVVGQPEVFLYDRLSGQLEEPWLPAGIFEIAEGLVVSGWPLSCLCLFSQQSGGG